MTTNSETAEITSLLTKEFSSYSQVCIIVSTPRSCSTALAKALCNHKYATHYYHEPFDTFYRNKSLTQFKKNIDDPIAINSLTSSEWVKKYAIVKEMSFQVENHFQLLATATKLPIIFLIRDPRAAIHSRLKLMGSTTFPFCESGWDDIMKQIHFCQSNEVDYIICDGSYLRSKPKKVLSSLCQRLEMPFLNSMLDWSFTLNQRLGHIWGAQASWYFEVQNSSHFSKESSGVVALNQITSDHRMQNHIQHCFNCYNKLLKDPHIIT